MSYTLLRFGINKPDRCMGWKDRFNVHHDCVAHVPDVWQCATCGREEAASMARKHIAAVRQARAARAQGRKWGPAGPDEDPFR